jgi:ATP/maltotriose-dependent transcriptional regulator MalT
VAERDALKAAREAAASHRWEDVVADLAEVRFDAAADEADRLVLVADASWWLGRTEDCIESRQAAYRIYEELGSTREAGMCAVWLYEQHCQRARGAMGSAWLQRARRALESDDGCVEQGALLLREAELAHGSGELEPARLLADRALGLGRSLGSVDLEAEALQTIGRVLIDDGAVALGFAHLDEAMLLAVEGRLGPYSTGKVYCSLIGACEDVGDLRRAAEWTEATTTWAEQHPLAIFPGICRIHHAVVLDRRGAMQRAEEELSRACEDLLESHLANAAAAFAEVGDIRRRLGELDRAEEAFARAEELGGQPCAGSALLRLAQGRVDTAERIITDCLARQFPSRLARARLLPAAAQIAVAAGHVERADASVRELEETAESFDTPMLRAMAALGRGRVLLARGELAPACASLRDAVARWQALGVPFEEATARTVLAQAHREAGDEDAAAACFAAARASFERIGAVLDPGAPEVTGQADLPGGLSPREVEVLRLIAAGLSNKEIAAELHLSVKTVSRHLSNIFTKIGVSSRSAATAYAFEHHIVGGGFPSP